MADALGSFQLTFLGTWHPHKQNNIEHSLIVFITGQFQKNNHSQTAELKGHISADQITSNSSINGLFSIDGEEQSIDIRFQSQQGINYSLICKANTHTAFVNMIKEEAEGLLYQEGKDIGRVKLKIDPSSVEEISKVTFKLRVQPIARFFQPISGFFKKKPTD